MPCSDHVPCCRGAEALGPLAVSTALGDEVAADSEAAAIVNVSTGATVTSPGADAEAGLLAEGIALGCACIAVPVGALLADGRTGCVVGAVDTAPPELARCAQPVRTKPSKSQAHR